MAPDPTGALQPTRSLWISRPWIDLTIGCAGWSLPLLAIAYRLTGPAALALSTTFYSLALVVNYPHYMATVYRAYAGGEWRRYPAFTVWATLALVAIGVAAHVQTALIPILFTAYVMWSPWHYSGQNYGLMMMFARRGGHQLARRQQHILKAAFFASYLMLLVSFNTGPSSDPLVLSLGLPASLARLISNAALAAFTAGAGVAVFALVTQRRGGGGDACAPVAAVAGFMVRGTRTDQHDHGRGGAADALQFRRARADAFGPVPVDHAVFREARTRAQLVGRALLVHRDRRRHRAVPAGAVGGQHACAGGLHGEHDRRHRRREHPPLHDRRRRVEAARPARVNRLDHRCGRDGAR